MMMDKGGLTAYGGDATGSNGRPAGWNKSKYYGQDDKLAKLAAKVGYKVTDKSTNADFQRYLLSPEVAKRFPRIKQAITKLHSTYGDPNAGSKWDDNYLGVRWDSIFDAIDEYEDPKFSDPEGVRKISQLGKEYGITLDDLKKGKYVQKNLPFSQITPELANFANAQNTYGYYTPDTTHWELNPQTLNIQPQLQDIDASMNALYGTTTGNPALDAAQKRAAYVEGLKAKQNAFGNKQNYDANARFETDKYNMAARTGEQNLDAQLTSKIHNDYRAAAKDAAAYERISALQNIVKKQAQNKKNEAEKSLMIDNFADNFEVDENGNFKLIGDGLNLQKDPYGNIDDEDVDFQTATPPYLPIDPSKPYMKPGDMGFTGPLRRSMAPINPDYIPVQQPELFMSKPFKGENGMMVDYNYDPSYMMPIRPIKKAKSLDKYFLRK